METPAHVEFHGLTPDTATHAAVLQHIEGLEQRFGRITACRVAVTAPSGHHRTSGLFEVNIWLSLPDGRQVAVVRTPQADMRHADLAFALNNAFKRARRQLQDQVRRLRGDVKTHEGQPVATIVRVDTAKGFGFLCNAEGDEIYFHRNSVVDGHFAELKPGTRVVYVETAGEKGPQATTVKLLGRHGLRL